MALSLLSLLSLLWDLMIPISLLAIVTIFTVLVALQISQNATVPRVRPNGQPVHLLVVLGSGGHTSEMLYMLEKVSLDPKMFTYRTYVVSSGDQFSARKAKAFETDIFKSSSDGDSRMDYTIVTIPRARRVHQSYWTAPFSTLRCLFHCFLVLLGRHPDQPQLPPEYESVHPDLIVTNGPAIAVCIILAAKLLRFFIFIYRWITGRGSQPAVPRLRTIFVESWARVKSLSTSGVLILPLADSFLVQWPDLAGRKAWWGMKKTKYVAWTVL